MKVMLVIDSKATLLSFEPVSIAFALTHPLFNQIEQEHWFWDSSIIDVQLADEVDIIFLPHLRLYGRPQSDGPLGVQIGVKLI
jgi:hypothetical protein